MSEGQGAAGPREPPQRASVAYALYSTASVPARREWYRRLDHVVLEETDDYLMTEGGFRSELFSEARLRNLGRECVPLALRRHCLRRHGLIRRPVKTANAFDSHGARECALHPRSSVRSPETVIATLERNARRLLEHLERQGFIR